jgi:hypothetical protein
MERCEREEGEREVYREHINTVTNTSVNMIP